MKYEKNIIVIISLVVSAINMSETFLKRTTQAWASAYVIFWLYFATSPL